MRNEIFRYIQPGEELVREPFQRLIEKQALLAYKYNGFWQCMDTFKDKQHLEELNQGSAPWKVWNHGAEFAHKRIEGGVGARMMHLNLGAKAAGGLTDSLSGLRIPTISKSAVAARSSAWRSSIRAASFTGSCSARSGSERLKPGARPSCLPAPA